ncbi:MAG TPA: PKD domain-containing protein [Marmoricola sp.]|nr:PKD domain-containing protein [Marmoricola sp.]
MSIHFRVRHVVASLFAVLGLVVGGCSTTPGGLPPVAVISASPVSGVAPLAVGFDSVGSSDPDGSIASYAWEFGDGGTASGAAVSHVYATAGNYTAKLTVTDDSGLTGSVTQVIEVSVPVNQAPTAAFVATPDSGPRPLVVGLDGSGSDDPDGSIVSWVWDFGDGSPFGSGETTSHTFAASAVPYTVSLTVTDDGGATDTVTHEVSVHVDDDGDGVSPPADCNDADAGIHPGAADPVDGVDQDCNGADGSPVSDAEKISSGYGHSCMIRQNGTLWCWGSNDYGQLGDGTNANRIVAVQVGTDHDWDTLAAGHYHTCATKTNGTAWCWGRNAWGSVGDGTNTDRNTPTQVGVDTDWSEISSAAHITCATKANGTAWCWGNNTNGQLGDGTSANRNTPGRVGTEADWATIRTGNLHVCGTRTNGTAWCWGLNQYGQLGDGTTIDRNTPRQVVIGTDWARIVPGEYRTCATKTDGTAWCWGSNSYGEFGDGTTTNKTTPTEVGDGSPWATFSGGVYFHNCGTRTDGSAWCWGHNQFGKLGDGTTINRSSPTQVGVDSNWVTIMPGITNTCGIKTDGTAWCWGRNVYGQLGDGTTTDRTTPVPVLE